MWQLVPVRQLSICQVPKGSDAGTWACRCKSSVLRPFFESDKPARNLHSPFPVLCQTGCEESSLPWRKQWLPRPGRVSAMSCWSFCSSLLCVTQSITHRGLLVFRKWGELSPNSQHFGGCSVAHPIYCSVHATFATCYMVERQPMGVCASRLQETEGGSTGQVLWSHFCSSFMDTESEAVSIESPVFSFSRNKRRCFLPWVKGTSEVGNGEI